MLSPSSTEKKFDEPEQGALMRWENDMCVLKYLNSIIFKDDFRAMKSIRGLKSQKKLAHGPEIRTKYFPFDAST